MKLSDSFLISNIEAGMETVKKIKLELDVIHMVFFFLAV